MLTGALPNNVITTLEAPELIAQDDRGEKAAEALERAWPGTRLIYEVGEDNGRSTLISREKDRAAWLRAAASRGEIPMISTDEADPILLYGSNHKVRFAAAGATNLLAVVCQYPLREETSMRASEVLAGLGQAVAAYWGVATPFDTAARIGAQVSPPGIERQPPPGLPVLRIMDDLAGPDVPQKLGWINYWSAPVAQRLNFPDPKRDAEWLPRAQKLDNGAWVVRLTEEPLDLQKTHHMEVLANAYSRFESIGRAAV